MVRLAGCIVRDEDGTRFVTLRAEE